MIAFDRGPHFDSAEIIVTHDAARKIPPADIQASLARHLRGDWGDLEPEDLYSYREDRLYEKDAAGEETWTSWGEWPLAYEDVESTRRDVFRNVAWLTQLQGEM